MTESVTAKPSKASRATAGPETADSDSVAPDNSESGSDESDGTPMARDLNRICEGELLSGALDLPLGDRASHTAIWLASNLESQAGREFSAALRALPISERATRVREELEKHSIAKCSIIQRWAAFEAKR